MRIDGLVITFCLGLGVADLLTINLVLSPRLAGEPVLAPAALALAVRSDPADGQETRAARTEAARPPDVRPAPTQPETQAPPPAPAQAPGPVETVAAPVPVPASVPVTAAGTPRQSVGGAQPLAVVYFEKSLSRLDTASRAKVDELATALRRHPDWKIRVSGHTDPTGPDDWNRRLSKRRARVVAARLERAGIIQERIETEGRAALDPCGSAESCRRAQVAVQRGDE